MDNKLVLTIQSIFKGEGFTKATQATTKLSKDVKDAGGAVKDLAGSMGQLGGQVGKVAGGAGKLMSLLGAGPIGLLVAGVTAIVSAFVKWKNTMKEVQDKMQSLARSKLDDMWESLHKRIAKAAQAQNEFFDKAIQKGRMLLQFSKDESAARTKVRDAEYNDEIERYRQNQAKADAELAEKKRANLSNPNMSREEAEYLNKQLDLDNQKQHVDTERRIAGELHKMKMSQMEEQKAQLQKEMKQLEDESKRLYDKDARAKQYAQTQQKAQIEQVERDMKNSLEYRQLTKRQRRRMDSGAMESWSADTRKHFYEDEEKLHQMQKDMRAKQEQANKFMEDYAKSNEDMVKRQQEINARLGNISRELETLDKQTGTQQRMFETQNKNLDAKYHDVWSKIEEASKERTARNAVKTLERRNTDIQNQADAQSRLYKNAEFKRLVQANADYQKALTKRQMFETTIDPHDKNNKTLKQSNPDEYRKIDNEVTKAADKLREAYKVAQEKFDALWAGGLDIAQRHDQANMARGERDIGELQRKIDSGGYSKEVAEGMKKEIAEMRRAIRGAEIDLLKMAEVRTERAKEGLDKQAAIKNELELIRDISDRNKAILQNIENNTRARERQDLTGEGRKARRNAERDRNLENIKLENRIRAQEKAAQRDAEKGWALDANGNLVPTKGLASGKLSQRQKERLKEYLEKERLENIQKNLNKKEDNAQQKVQNSLDQMLQTLKNVDNNLMKSISAQ